MADDETILECLKGYVGISPGICLADDAEDPGSGLFLTDLPGISLQNIEAIADQEQKNFLGVCAVVEKRTLLKFRSAVLVEINKCFCISDITVIDCLVCGSPELFGMPLWYLMGAELCYERMYSDAINRFTTIDKKRASELRNDFLIDFQTELANAMKGIDLNESDCIDSIQESGNVQWIESPVC